MLRLPLFALAFGLAATAAAAQDTGATAPPDADPDAALRDQTRSLGLSVGNHYACVEGPARDALQEDTLVIFDLILKDVGSDLAFIYAASAGYGASLPAGELDCEKLAESWSKIKTHFGLAEE
ncbi:MAG: hypothetical protein AAF074_23510 [Pseudomonadota bacterium]